MQSSYHNKDKRIYGDVSYERKYLLDPKYLTKRDIQHYYRNYHVSKSQRHYKKIIFIILTICLIAYLFVDYNLRTKIIQFRDRFEFLARVDGNYNITQAYFVNTPGCHIPYFDVSNYHIMQYIGSPPKLKCKKSITRASDLGSRLWWTMTDKEIQHYYKVNDTNKINCHYTPLQHNYTLSVNTFGTEISFKLLFNQSIEIIPETEFIRVRCSDGQKQYFYEDYHFFALNKTNSKIILQEKSKDNVRRKELRNARGRHAIKDNSYMKNKTNMPGQQLSIMILGIDSVSHLNFLRHMKRTADFIRKHLNYVEFWGFNKVGDNTYPNLIPLLTGLASDELKLSCMRAKGMNYIDGCPFIWKRFKEAGYITAFLEDVAESSIFGVNPIFKYQPTDYYIRPITLEMEKKIQYYYSVNVNLCMGGRRTVDLVLEMVHKLMPFLQTENFFSLFWLLSMTQDLIYMPKLLDNDFVDLFERFQTSGIFNKTVVLLMSDHGLRWGSFRGTYQGMMEERQPLLVAIYPTWFKQKYAKAVYNLENNAKRLTTFYDVYATLLDLLNLDNLRPSTLQARSKEILESDVIPRGISLFLSVPETRTCENAGIAKQWCTCYQRTEMPTNDGQVQEAARYTVKLINEQLKSYPQCRVLYLNSILEAVMLTPHNTIIRDVNNDYGVDISLRLQTKPGLAVFESTVRIAGSKKKLASTISRLNLYESQSYCIKKSELKMYCYCHR
ncbi:uncharacterized protein LOC101462702 isoform X2 [Ceratitis capitata]|uniref:(Mediterranean fruit fly) hypothetical protein n=1 Tax=Ceratitis capitata TaxID=7213 RepID=W8C726_CERCA|nr:uncharacterized protein LOC101462702 isoform X2 [Ceratitis capitata]CAD6998483.1 unnamed protein product [Ceratitis capitata]